MKKSRLKRVGTVLVASGKLPRPVLLPFLSIFVLLQVPAWSQGTTSEHLRIGKELALNLEVSVETGVTFRADPYADEPGFRFDPRAMVSVSLWNRLTVNTGLQGAFSQVIGEDGSIVSDAAPAKIRTGASWRFVVGPYRVVPVATLDLCQPEAHVDKPVLGIDGGISVSWLRDPIALGASANASFEQDGLALGAGLSLTEAFNENISATGSLESSMDLSRALEIAYIESGNLYTSVSFTLMAATRLGSVHAMLSLPLARPLSTPSFDLGMALRFVSLRH